jgi:hypothetical protein
LIGSYVAVPSGVSKPPTPPLGGSEDPSIVGAVGSTARRLLANESPLDRRWCRSGNDRPEGLTLQSRPGFRASNEPARRPVRGRHSKRSAFRAASARTGPGSTRLHGTTSSSSPSRRRSASRGESARPKTGEHRLPGGDTGDEMGKPDFRALFHSRVRAPTPWFRRRVGRCSPGLPPLQGVPSPSLEGAFTSSSLTSLAAAPARRSWLWLLLRAFDCGIGLSLSRLPPLLRFPTLSE